MRPILQVLLIAAAVGSWRIMWPFWRKTASEVGHVRFGPEQNPRAERLSVLAGMILGGLAGAIIGYRLDGVPGATAGIALGGNLGPWLSIGPGVAIGGARES